jgi:hypothetical protein
LSSSMDCFDGCMGGPRIVSRSARRWGSSLMVLVLGSLYSLLPTLTASGSRTVGVS